MCVLLLGFSSVCVLLFGFSSLCFAIWRDSIGPSLAFGLFQGDVGFIGPHRLVGKQVLETKTFQLVEWGRTEGENHFSLFAIWFDTAFGI